jgi:hypothetical protein
MIIDFPDPSAQYTGSNFNGGSRQAATTYRRLHS